ncbi:MAG: DUF2853 family protein [Bacteroidia bacterium]
MSKFDETVSSMIEEMKKLGLSCNEALLGKVAKGLGPALYNRDASTVSCSDQAELDTVKNNFLIKKHGLADGENLDAAIKAVCEKMGSSNRNKYRAIFYYLLTEDLGLAGNY